jgi:hypothetical protein
MKRIDKKNSRVPKMIFALLVLLFTLLTSTDAIGQGRWSVSLRPGINFATQDLGTTELKTGFGIEGTLGYRFMPHLGAYAGWSWNKFAAENTNNDLDFEETGYCFGLQFIHPIGGSGINYLLRAGGLYNHIEVENKDGDLISDSGHGLGWELEAGLAFPVGRRFQLVPGLRYRSLSRDLAFSGVSTPVELNYISVGLGLKWTLGQSR